MVEKASQDPVPRVDLDWLKTGSFSSSPFVMTLHIEI